MRTKLKIALLIFILLFQPLFPQEAKGESFRDAQTNKKALAESYHEIRGGIGDFGKGLWGLITNTGKLLWYGTHEGFAKSKKADAWVRKHLW